MTVAIGRRTHKNSPRSRATARTYNAPFFLLSIIIVLLTLIGLMMVLSSSQVHALTYYKDSWYFFKKQLLWIGLGSAALVVLARIPYQFLRKLVIPIYGAVALMLFAVLIPGVGVKVAGAQRWIGVGDILIQPSEFAKFAVILFFADLFARREHHVDDWQYTLRPALLAGGAIAFLVIMQPDMGTMMVIVSVAMAIVFVAGVSWSRIGVLVASGVVGALFLGLVEGYRRARFVAFLDPWKDPSKIGYQNVQSLVGLSTGGLVGVGLGASRAKWGFLPNAFTDFIFAIIGEEFGFIGAALVIGLFVAFGFVGVRVARRAPDRFGMLLATGIVAWVIGQALLNIGAVIGLLPITGVPLPFVSFGGSSLMVLLATMGVLLNIAQQGSDKNERRSQRA